jgi:hypothetical protein
MGDCLKVGTNCIRESERKVSKGDEYDQNTSYACKKYNNEAY